MVPPSSHGVSRVPRYSGYSSLTRSFTYMTLTFFGMSSHTFQLKLINTKCCPKPQKYCYSWFGLFRFRSPLLTESQLMSSPPGTEMFHFPGYGFRRLFDSAPDGGTAPAGLPHSDTPGSKSAATPRGFSQFAASFFA